MKAKNKKIICFLLVAGSIFLVYSLWLSLRPVEIVAVHQRHHFSDVLVKNFPFTDKGKINWWLRNKDILKEKYRIPNPVSYGNFYVNFWDFGEGYKEEGKYDRLCFDDMKKKETALIKMRFSLWRMTGATIYCSPFTMEHIV